MTNKKQSSQFFYCLFTLITFCFSLFFYCPATFAAAKDSKAVIDYKAGELLIKFKNSEKLYKINFDKNLDINQVIGQYKKYGQVEYAEPNYLFKTAAFPNDPLYYEQWYLRAANFPDAWSNELLTREQENINRKSIIAILDTGVYLDHPDLKDQIWVNRDETPNDSVDNDNNGYVDDINGWDFVFSTNNPNPSFEAGYDSEAVNHGTLVAGIAAAAGHNNVGIAGASWFSQIMPLRVLDSVGSGNVYNVVRAIDYAIVNGADIINMSFVGSGYSPILADAISRAYNKGILIVAAAGNTDPAVNGINLDVTKSYPVCYDGDLDKNMVIGVASIDKNFKKSPFSNYGSCIDITTTGENFYSTAVYDQSHPGFDKYYDGYWSGTSLSTPLVSGALGILKNLRPEFSAQELKNIILNNSQNIYSYNPNYLDKLGRGKLDVAKSVEALLGQPISQLEKDKVGYFVAGLGLGSFPQVKIIREDGTVFKAFYAYSPYFKGLINVATGDINGDGRADVVTAPAGSGGPHIKVFNTDGQLLLQFFAYEKSFYGGVNIAVGDIDGDGKKEIITGSGKGRKPEVRIFDSSGKMIASFLAYAQNFYGGVKVAVGDVNGDRIQEIVVGAGSGGGPHVRIFDSSGNVLTQFFANNKNFRGGINVAVGDLNGDSLEEIIVGVESQTSPIVKIFDYDGEKINEFFADDSRLFNGVNLTTGDYNNDGVAEIIAGSGAGSKPTIKIFDFDGRLKLTLPTHNDDYKGGTRPAFLKN